MSYTKTVESINRIQGEFIKKSLCDEYNPPATSTNSDFRVIGFNNDTLISIAYSDTKYVDIYNELESKKAFSLKLIDGALIQISYRFHKSKEEVLQHRLAYFPRADLPAWDSDPEFYKNENVFAEMFSESVIQPPFRFDYKHDEKAEDHAKSHFTIGQIKNCRIPVCSPLSPGEFIRFIMQNFYFQAYKLIPSEAYKSSINSNVCLTAQDKSKFHMVKPI